MQTANKCYQAGRQPYEQRWYVVDATDQVLGRLAVKIAQAIMGKNKPTYTPHVDTGDFVVVLNAGKVKVTGNKKDVVEYQHYTRYPSGQKRIKMREMLDRHPERVLEAAVRRMIPKTPMGRKMLSKLKLYRGAEHPHQSQMPDPLPL